MVMERQRSFSSFKRTRILLFLFTIPPSILFLFLLSSRSLSSPPPPQPLFSPHTPHPNESRHFLGQSHTLGTSHFQEPLPHASQGANRAPNPLSEVNTGSQVWVRERRNGGGSDRFERSILSSGGDAAAVACDASDGRWVFDESYPLYNATSCPYMDEGFSCEANGRWDKGYMKWRWKPHHCSIPRFRPLGMLELIRGKRLVFVGDSINRNQWESIMCMLRGAVKDPKGRKITKYRGNYNFKFIDYHASVEYYVSHFLVQESKARIGRKRMKTLRIDSIDRSSIRWKGADILVFNTAHWWSHYKTKAGVNYYQERDQIHPHLDVSTAFTKALTTWASWVDGHATQNTRVFFRTSSPTHFSGGEWNSGGHCKESKEPLNDTFAGHIPEINRIVDEVIKQMKTRVTILNITKLSGLRIDGHPSIYGRKPGRGTSSSIEDCSHWCLPGVPDTWNELLYFHLLSSQKPVSAE